MYSYHKLNEKFSITMNNFAPRQKVFAVVLLISFILHLVLLVISTSISQNEYQRKKGEYIINQLDKEVAFLLSSQDRVSLSVLSKRYQGENDIAKLVITDVKNIQLVQSGSNQTQTGETLEKIVTRDGMVLGHIYLTMKKATTGEIVSDNWIFLFGSFFIHILLFLIYGHVARITQEHLKEIGRKIEEKIEAQHNTLQRFEPNFQQANRIQAINKNLVNETNTKPKNNLDFLQKKQTPIGNSTKNNMVDMNALPNQVKVQFRFYDKHHLLHRVAPEMANPYLQLCEELLQRACENLFQNPDDSFINRQIMGVRVENTPNFTHEGAIVELVGKPEELALAAVMLGKLFIILNQVVYEKYRESARFALPICVGMSSNHQFENMQTLLNNHAEEDGLLMLFPSQMFRQLRGQVQLRGQSRPTNFLERDMVWYDGLSEYLMTNLIEKRNVILAIPDTNT